MRLVQPLVLVLLALLPAGCGEAEAAPAPASTDVVDDEQVAASTLFLEECASEFFVELSRSTVLFTEVSTSLRFVPWRRVHRSGETEARVRMSLGYGAGFSRALTNAWGNDGAEVMGYFFGAMADFEEHSYFQLSPEEIESVLEFLEAIESVELERAPDLVTNRFVQGNWGDLHLRKTDAGVFLSVSDAGWEPLPTDRFQAGLRQARESLEALVDGKPSAEW